MNWSQRVNTLFKVGIFYTNRKETQRKEHERSECRYQLYEAFSNWANIRVKAEQKGRPLNPLFSCLFITPKYDAQMVSQYHITKDLGYDCPVKKDDLGEEEMSDKFETDSMILYLNRQLNWAETTNILKLQHDFIVKKDDLEEKEKLQLDFTLHSSHTIGKNTKIGDTLCEGKQMFINEILPFNLQTLMQKESVSFTLPFDIEYSVNTRINMSTDVRFRNVNQLCLKEEDFVKKRKTFVFNQMRDKLGLQKLLQVEKDAPTIAVIGSGGGMRAVIGMCGAMTALQDNGILDCTMYTAGLSGSAWYLMALYVNDKQNNPKAITDIVRQRLNRVPKQFLTCSESNHSNSDVPLFGIMIGYLLLEKDHFPDSWSEQKVKLKDGSVPLPLLMALHDLSEEKIKHYNEWIEFSPYEVSIPKYGAAIDMKNFGDVFYGGFILEKNSKRSICYLLELCGSGFTKVRELKPQEIKWYKSYSGIKDWIMSFFRVSETIFDSKCVAKFPNWLHGIELKPLFGDQDSENGIIYNDSKEIILMDGGFAFNSPYPTVLHPARKVDVILSFDFSERDEDRSWPFEELEKAEKWANERRVPFPKLNPKLMQIKQKWEKGIYEEVYVFRGDDVPTIVHFVLINNSLRKDETVRGNFRIFPEYRTQRFKYSERDFDQLKLLVEQNVRKNNEKINECILEVIHRRLSNAKLEQEHKAEH